jgi:hypothetical protein
MLTNVSNQRRIQTDIQMAKANSTAEIGALIFSFEDLNWFSLIGRTTERFSKS